MKDLFIKNLNGVKKALIIFGAVFAFAVLPRVVLAATLYASPSSGTFGLGSTFSVSIRTNTQGADVNTAEASISYSTDTLELVSVKQGSTFYLAAPGSPSKGSGTAYFGGGLPTPGYNGTGGIVGTATFRAKALGTGTVTINSGKVLLNDGNGTDALASSAGGRYTITPPPVGAVTVTSDTHPVQDNWYAKSDVNLSWDRPTGAYGYSFVLDQTPDTVPGNTLDTTTTTTQSYPGLKDGVWYFHIKARAQSASAGFGPTAHFKIQIDTQKPLLFDIKMVAQSDLNDVTRTPTITFEATDETSGIDHYDVYIDGNVVQASAESPYTFSKLDNGPHVIRVIAYDKAGNDRKAELPIIVNGPAVVGFFQKNLQVPIYLLIIINLAVLVLFAFLIWFLFKRKKKQTTAADQVADIQAEIDQSLEELKQRISDRLLSLTAKSNKELFDKEEKVSKEVAVSVGKTRRRIDKKIGKLNKTVRKQKDKILE